MCNFILTYHKTEGVQPVFLIESGCQHVAKCALLRSSEVIIVKGVRNRRETGEIRVVCVDCVLREVDPFLKTHSWVVAFSDHVYRLLECRFASSLLEVYVILY